MMASAMMKSMVAASHSVLSNIDAPAAGIPGKHAAALSESGKDMASPPHRGHSCVGACDATGGLVLPWLQACLRRGRYARQSAENDAMTPEGAERWKELERRAREHGWTIDSLEVPPDRPGTATAGKSATRKGEFALMELGGDERVLATGDLDTIDLFLKSSRP
jgi:hypothetical protein